LVDRKVKVQFLVEVFHPSHTTNEIGSIIYLLNKGFLAIVFILNLSDELFKNILNRYDTRETPVFIENDCHMDLFLPHLFEKIINQAHHNGEPGLLFLDGANRSNPVPHLYPLEATNPCGEQWLGPYENCCLGSVNLNEHCGPDGGVDWEACASRW
jgi:hypothetical protein